jgi:hypothetical protein
VVLTSLLVRCGGLSMNFGRSVDIRLSVDVSLSVGIGLSVNISTMMGYWWPMKLSAPPMMTGMLSIPGVIVPVVVTTPIPPVAMEVTIMYPMISWRQTQNIIRRYSHNNPRNKRCPNSYPRPVVNGSPEPVISVEAIPVTSVEIKTYSVRHQIDIASSTRDYHYIRRCCKLQRRGRGNADVDVHLGLTNKCHAKNKKHGSHK